MNNYLLPDQLNAAAVSLLFGIAFGAVYDVFRVLRVLLGLNRCVGAKRLYGVKMPISGYTYRIRTAGRSSHIFIALSDVLFFTLWGMSFSVLTCHASSGHVRWYSFIPMLCGFAAYYFTCGRIVMSAAHYAAFAMWAVGGYAVFLILLPVRLTAKTVKVLCGTVKRKLIYPVREKASYAAAVRKTEKLILSSERFVKLDIFNGEA